MDAASDEERAGLLGRSAQQRSAAPPSLLAISTLAYFSVCGGPFGLEVAIAAGSPLAVIGAIMLLAAVWSLPCALMTAELSAALPSSGGYVHWVGRAFGARTGALSGWLSLLNNFVDSSTYPVAIALSRRHQPAPAPPPACPVS